MATGKSDGKDDDAAARHIYGPRGLGAVLPALLRPIFRRRSPAAAHVLAEWEAIAGPAIAAISRPKRLFSGTLSISVSSANALELQHLSPALIERINTHLGHRAVSRLRFVQDFLAPPAPPATPQKPPARVAAARAVAHLPDGPLRDALERLGRSVLTDGPGAGAVRRGA